MIQGKLVVDPCFPVAMTYRGEEEKSRERGGKGGGGASALHSPKRWLYAVCVALHDRMDDWL